MPNYVPPADKSTGQTVDAVLDWNNLKNSLASYLNNGGIGNPQISTDPSEKIPESKLSLTAPTGAHGARHAAGGADPLPNGSISPAMLQSGLFTDDKLTLRRDADPTLATVLGVTYSPRAPRVFSHGTATSQPQGRGVARSGKIYFSLYNADKVTQLDPVLGTFADIALSAGDKPGQLLLVGTDIYVLCRGGGTGGQQIKKIDVANVVTTICNMRSDGGAAVSDLIDVDEMAYHPSGGFIFCIGKRTGDTVYRVLLRVSLTAATGVTHKVDLGVTNTPQFVGCVTGSNGSNERVAVLYHDTLPTNQIKTYAAADLTAVGSTAIGFTVAGTNVIVNDGAFANVFTNASVTWQQYEFLNYTNPVQVMTGATGGMSPIAPAFFDGKHIYTGVLSATRASIDTFDPWFPGLGTGGTAPGKDRTIDDPASAEVVNGFGTDGANIWLAVSNGVTDKARLVRCPG